jgi:hypothetical protein
VDGAKPIQINPRLGSAQPACGLLAAVGVPLCSRMRSSAVIVPMASLVGGARRNTNPTKQCLCQAWEHMIMRTIISLLVLIAVCGIGTVAGAQQSNECKLCREVQQVCLKNHSKDACNHEYTVCMNHCRKK